MPTKAQFVARQRATADVSSHSRQAGWGRDQADNGTARVTRQSAVMWRLEGSRVKAEQCDLWNVRIKTTDGLEANERMQAGSWGIQSSQEGK